MNARTLLTLAVVSLAPTPLLARPVLVPGALDAAPRKRLARHIARARKEHPAAFKAVADLRARLPRIAARQRGRLVTVVRPLRSLGADGLMPMLAALTVDDLPGGLSARARRGWQVSLLEAVGSLRDARAVPALEAILADRGQDPVVRRVAARALARRADDRAMATLLKWVAEPGQRPVVLPALGECRRLRIARALAGMLPAAASDEDHTLQVVKALGQVGNAWAWQTPAVSKSGEGEATRRVAMQALVAAYPALPGSTRYAAVKALALISHPSTRAHIASSCERRDACKELGQQLERLGSLR